MSEIDFSRPCDPCRDGHHDQCAGVCGCIADHADDESIMRGFKRLKRAMCPEREAWIKGGWSGLSGGTSPGSGQQQHTRGGGDKPNAEQ